MKHIVFPTYELHPVNPGGAGVLVAGMVRVLARAGIRSTVLGDFPEGEVHQANEGLAGEGFADPIRVVSVRSLIGEKPLRPGATHYEVNSAAFSAALQRLAEKDPFDLVEFPEYAGIGFAALRERLERGGFARVKLAVRIHGSLEAIDRAEQVRVDDVGRLRMYRMERLGMQLADALLSPSRELGASYRATYGLPESQAVLLAPPPMAGLIGGFQHAERLVDPCHFLFYGKLQEVKGCDLFVEAAVALIAEQPKRPWRFSLIGRDTPCTAHRRTVSECLRALIPPRYFDHFEFIPAIPREALPELARRPAAAVIPSRFETFCLAAHELRAVGLPVIVNDIPAFSGYFREETGGIRFDGTAAGLLVALKRVAADPAWAEALGRQPGPSYRDPVEPYLELLEDAAAAPERPGLRNELAAYDALAAEG
jgi:glycosyltransferase involved in cell wall biosynthesis